MRTLLPLLALTGCASAARLAPGSVPGAPPLDALAPDGADDTGTDGADDTGPDGGDDTAPGTPGDDTGPADTDTAPEGATRCVAWADPVATGTVHDAALDELSDIVPSRRNPGVLWSHEDSGGAAELYALDATGATLGTLTITGATNHDWEDLAVATCPNGDGDCLWIGDTGDNGLSRSDVAVLVVPEPRVDAPFAANATPTTYRYTFPSGRGNVEGLAVGADGLPVLVTKRVDGTAEVFRFPTLDATTTVTLTQLGTVVTGDASDEHPAEATSADIRADGGALLVRTYGFLWEYPLTTGGIGAGTALPAPDEGQGEAAAYDADGSVWLVSEGRSATVWHVPCAATE